jgi:hypothetical protein
MSNGSWRVDETNVKVKWRWIYLYRAVASRGQTIDFLLSAKRHAEAAKRFFRIGPASHGKPAHHHGGQECGLSESHCGDEEGRRTLAAVTAATRSSVRETVDPPGAWFWWLSDGRRTLAG